MRPGQLPWIATGQDDSADVLADKFHKRFRGRAAIVGPHGSGKSTLLEHLVPLLDCKVVWLKLRRSEQPLKEIRTTIERGASGGALVLDGFEQLSTLQAIRVCWMVRRRRMGLLVTCHRPSWLLPTLLTLTPTVGLVRQLVAECLAPCLTRCLVESHGRFDRREWADAMTDESRLASWLAEEHGNIREVFMRLYDYYEDRQQ